MWGVPAWADRAAPVTRLWRPGHAGSRGREWNGIGEPPEAPSGSERRLNAPDRLQPHPGMDFRLGQHADLGAEPLDDGADKWPHRRGGDQHGGVALARRILEALADEREEFRQLRGLHREALVLALADDRLG